MAPSPISPLEPARQVVGEDPTAFALQGPEGGLAARGFRRLLPGGPVETLATRAATFFAAESEGPRRLLGALPFDREAHDRLHQPEKIRRLEGPAEFRRRAAPPLAEGGSPWGVSPEPSRAAYMQAVAEALKLLRREEDAELRKVVLSRSVAILADRPIDREALLARLGEDPSVTVFCAPLSGLGEPPRALLGATPELLVSRKGRMVASHPLAGSARRGADPETDRRQSEGLLASEKDQREHAAVVEAVADALAPLCLRLNAPKSPSLRATAAMWHLGTRIEGELREDVPVAELLAHLHPTPAVCGLPRAAAARAISRLEGYDRGFYAGAVGWLDEAGDGEWHVSLRCAEIAGEKARLYAGAGVVPGSDPAAEAEETSAKLVTMLRALGVDETGRPLAERAA
ncbi:isochorismate synthase MenF [Neomegalonema sp.]|uniref:isochorismate synthase n=1 Tax=Neomegalonema sp. TaxID=2039713 RepID=UPI00260BFC48|nr:isochorismate synthase [Neomegalonema sp.]MDD2868686.1 isochorismate synthase [Neomegalonema sp.]